MAHVIVIGNEKGGSGKTTTAMHLIISLLEFGFKVGVIDLDSRQQSLARYLENRKKTAESKQLNLLMPEYKSVVPSTNNNRADAGKEEEENVMQAITELQALDFIVIDTPGSDSVLSRVVHSAADTVITPINDSFIDLDLIGNVSADTLDSIKPGVYSAMLWEAKMKRATKTKQEQNWILVRNRLSQIDAHNKRNMEISLQKLSKRFGFRIAPGFSDRVVFKELFLRGLTLHDAMKDQEIKITTSVLAARLELLNFIKALDIKAVLEKVEERNAA
jgi:chromosome partitioning protein